MAGLWVNPVAAAGRDARAMHRTQPHVQLWITVIQTSYLHLRPARTGPSPSPPRADCPQTTQSHGMLSSWALRLAQGTGITKRNKLGIEGRATGFNCSSNTEVKYTCFVVVTHIGKHICGIGSLGKDHCVVRGRQVLGPVTSIFRVSRGRC